MCNWGSSDSVSLSGALLCSSADFLGLRGDFPRRDLDCFGTGELGRSSVAASKEAMGGVPSPGEWAIVAGLAEQFEGTREGAGVMICSSPYASHTSKQG